MSNESKDLRKEELKKRADRQKKKQAAKVSSTENKDAQATQVDQPSGLSGMPSAR
jgi:hypothetical protein